jgi:D-galactarolactone cycloisomerase
LKIENVKASYLEIPLPEPGLRKAFHHDIVDKNVGLILVKLFTDEDIIGIGAQVTTFGKWSIYYAKYIEEVLKPSLLNEIVEPFYIEKFARHLRFSSPSSISPRPCCIEMAMWDIVGKKANLPIYKLLGAYQDKVLAYASVSELYPLWTAKKWSDFVEGLIKDGFKAVKLHIGWLWKDPQKVLDVVKILRETVGYDIEIMIDAMQAWTAEPNYTFESVLKYARGLEEYGCAWLEEPMPYLNNPSLSAKLCDAVDIPIAGGGQIFGVHAFKHILETGALDILQPDVQLAGGLLEVKRIIQLAEDYGKQCSPHFMGTGIPLAATLQVLGSANIPWVEYPYHPPLWTPEVRDCMLKDTIKIDKDGYVKIPDGPGLGIELNEDVVSKYTVYS